MSLIALAIFVLLCIIGAALARWLGGKR